MLSILLSNKHRVQKERKLFKLSQDKSFLSTPPRKFLSESHQLEKQVVVLCPPLSPTLHFKTPPSSSLFTHLTPLFISHPILPAIVLIPPLLLLHRLLLCSSSSSGEVCQPQFHTTSNFPPSLLSVGISSINTLPERLSILQLCSAICFNLSKTDLSLWYSPFLLSPEVVSRKTSGGL